jgi:hypothetical protein
MGGKTMSVSGITTREIDPAQVEVSPSQAAVEEAPAAPARQAPLDASCGPLNPYRTLGFELRSAIAQDDAQGAAALAGAAARAANAKPATADSKTASAALGAALASLRADDKLADFVKLLVDAEYPDGNLGDLPPGITARARVGYFVDTQAAPDLKKAWVDANVAEIQRRVDAGG